MLKVRSAAISLGIAMMLTATATLFAQTASKAAVAPLPSQILTAKKVFISNAGGGLDPKLWAGGPAQPYNELYAAIKSWGRYDLVAAPGDADLVLQISYIDLATDETVRTNGVLSNPQCKLQLLDPKTHIVLWTLQEGTSVSHFQKGRDNSLEETVNKLVADLKALTAQSAAAAK